MNPIDIAIIIASVTLWNVLLYVSRRRKDPRRSPFTRQEDWEWRIFWLSTTAAILLLIAALIPIVYVLWYWAMHYPQ